MEGLGERESYLRIAKRPSHMVRLSAVSAPCSTPQAAHFPTESASRIGHSGTPLGTAPC